MADDKYTETVTEAEQDEAIFMLGMLWIIDQERVLVGEDGCGFLQCGAV